MDFLKILEIFCVNKFWKKWNFTNIKKIHFISLLILDNWNIIFILFICTMYHEKKVNWY